MVCYGAVLLTWTEAVTRCYLCVLVVSGPVLGLVLPDTRLVRLVLSLCLASALIVTVLLSVLPGMKHPRCATMCVVVLLLASTT